MRLLPKKQVVELNKASEKKLIETAEKRRKVLQDEYDRLKRYEELLGKETTEKTEAFFILSKELESKSKGLINEVKRLEIAKIEALKPVDLKEKEFEKREQVIVDSKNELKTTEKTLEKRERTLIKERKSLEETSLQIKQTRSQLSENEAEIKRRAETLKKNELEYLARASKLKQDEEKLGLHRIDVNNKESALDGKLEAIKNKEDFVNKQLKLIESRQAQLRVAYLEMKKYDKSNIGTP